MRFRQLLSVFVIMFALAIAAARQTPAAQGGGQARAGCSSHDNDGDGISPTAPTFPRNTRRWATRHHPESRGPTSLQVQ